MILYFRIPQENGTTIKSGEKSKFDYDLESNADEPVNETLNTKNLYEGNLTVENNGEEKLKIAYRLHQSI